MRFGLFVYSGTGNTRHTAEVMGNFFNSKENCACLIYDIGNAIKNPSTNFADKFDELDCIGIGVPVYYLREPTGVLSWINSLPEKCLKGKLTFIFSTAGNGSSSQLYYIREQLKANGVALISNELIIHAPTGWPIGNPSLPVDQSFFHWSEKELDKATEFASKIFEIASQEPSQHPKALEPSGLNIPDATISSVYKYLFNGGFQVNTDECVGCKTCEIGCPRNAIKVVNGKAQIDQTSCVLCSRCFNVCPHKAITVPGMAPKPQYTAHHAVIVSAPFSWKPTLAIELTKSFVKMHPTASFIAVSTIVASVAIVKSIW